MKKKLRDFDGAEKEGAPPLRIGERVKQLRRAHGWTLDQLSAVCGVSRSMISEIERDQANPTLAVALRMAQAFGMGIDELLRNRPGQGGIDIVRAADSTYDYMTSEECRIRTLSPLHLEKDIEVYQIRLGSGAALKSEAHFPGTRELVTVQKGQLRLVAGGQETVLQEGDSGHYRADVRHELENLSRRECILLLVVHYPRGNG